MAHPLPDLTDHDTIERPDWACLLCPPPRQPGRWRPADPGYRTDSGCLDTLRDRLRDIAERHHRLDPRPGADNDHRGRGAPGFGSRAPASDHVIAMTDRRSKPCETSWDAIAYVFDPLADTTLQPGQHGPPGGAYVQKREVWYGADGRPHAEQETPPRCVPLVLAGIAGLIAEDRDLTAPATHQVADLVRWIDRHLDHVTRQPWVADVADDLRELHDQLKPVTGDPGRRTIGACPNTIDDGPTTRECGSRLFAPLRGDEIRCRTCGRTWPREEWLRLGNLLGQACCPPP